MITTKHNIIALYLNMIQRKFEKYIINDTGFELDCMENMRDILNRKVLHEGE